MTQGTGSPAEAAANPLRPDSKVRMPRGFTLKRTER
jgi:hypothetical protein